jgi:hypothetical protein
MSAGLLAPADIMNHQIADLGIPIDSLSSGAALARFSDKVAEKATVVNPEKERKKKAPTKIWRDANTSGPKISCHIIDRIEYRHRGQGGTPDIWP